MSTSGCGAAGGGAAAKLPVPARLAATGWAEVGADLQRPGGGRSQGHRPPCPAAQPGLPAPPCRGAGGGGRHQVAWTGGLSRPQAASEAAHAQGTGHVATARTSVTEAPPAPASPVLPPRPLGHPSPAQVRPHLSSQVSLPRPVRAWPSCQPRPHEVGRVPWPGGQGRACLGTAHEDGPPAQECRWALQTPAPRPLQCPLGSPSAYQGPACLGSPRGAAARLGEHLGSCWPCPATCAGSHGRSELA